MKAIRIQNWRIQALRCDDCGTFDPPHFDDNPRLCDACAKPGGLYKRRGETDHSKTAHGANGKIGWRTLAFPIKVEWWGWWKY